MEYEIWREYASEARSNGLVPMSFADWKEWQARIRAFWDKQEAIKCR